MNKIITLTATILFLSGCGDFLDKQPSVSEDAPVTEASQLIALCDNSNIITSYNYFAFYSTDDTELPKELYVASPSSFDIDNVVANYCHYREGIIGNSTDLFWENEYSNVYIANLIINSASSVSGSKEEIAEALGCAHFMRAYSFFELASYYCLPWSETNKGALGIPLRLGLDFTEDVSRGTLEKTYEQIFADLRAAEEYVTRDAVDPDMPWRVSKCAINALYSRIYLTRGEYEKALDYADMALSNAPKLFNYNDFEWGTPVSYPAAGDRPAETLEYCETNSWNEIQYLYYQEWIYPRFLQDRTSWIKPSRQLAELYDQENDLRFVFFFVEHGNRSWSVLYDWWGYNQFCGGYYVISGLTPQEMLLNKAEVMVRNGDWQNGLNVLDPLREARYKTDAVTYLRASSQAEALRLVLEERRRELPFTFRLRDIKRFAVNETPEDDVTITRDFFDVSTIEVNTSVPKTWVIPGNSVKLAMPIWQTEIDASHGMIEQNPGE